jgi:hypothetical protein
MYRHDLSNAQVYDFHFSLLLKKRIRSLLCMMALEVVTYVCRFYL